MRFAKLWKYSMEMNIKKKKISGLFAVFTVICRLKSTFFAYRQKQKIPKVTKSGL